jgi:hypothetical protein
LDPDYAGSVVENLVLEANFLSQISFPHGSGDQYAVHVPFMAHRIHKNGTQILFKTKLELFFNLNICHEVIALFGRSAIMIQ